MTISIPVKLISPTRTDAYIHVGESFCVRVRYSPWSEGMEIVWESPCCTEPIMVNVFRGSRANDAWSEAGCSGCDATLPDYYALSPRDDGGVLSHEAARPALVAEGLDPLTTQMLLNALDGFIADKVEYCRRAARSVHEVFLLEIV